MSKKTLQSVKLKFGTVRVHKRSEGDAMKKVVRKFILGLLSEEQHITGIPRTHTRTHFISALVSVHASRHLPPHKPFSIPVIADLLFCSLDYKTAGL